MRLTSDNRGFFILAKIVEKYYSADVTRFGAEYDAAEAERQRQADLAAAEEARRNAPVAAPQS